MADAPIEEKHREMMRAIAGALDDMLNGETRPKTVGFALFVFPFDGAPEGRMNYISNAERDGMIVAVREWLARAEGRVVETKTQQ